MNIKKSIIGLKAFQHQRYVTLIDIYFVETSTKQRKLSKNKVCLLD